MDTKPVGSMTGFGRVVGEVAGRRASVEIGSVNHRNLEVSTHLPHRWSRFELSLRRLVGSRLSRGKVRLSVRIPEGGDCEAVEYVYRPEVAEAYIAAFETLQERLGTEEKLSARDLLMARGVMGALQSPDDEAEEDEGSALLAQVERALEVLIKSRRREGEALRKDLLACCSRIRERLAELEGMMPEIRAQLRSRFEERIRDLLDGRTLPEERIQAELLVWMEKTEVHEELVRLEAHVEALEATLSEGGVVGRRLAFLGQEMNREANTIGAKATDPRCSRVVVATKDEIAKVREQVENLE